MKNLNYKTCIVTVTYADRWQLVKQIVDRGLSFEQVSDVIVVDNASVYNIKERIDEIGNDRLILVENKENLGSTGGYKAGIAKACETGADFIWLLDDDNLPDEDALDALLHSWDELSTPHDKTAFFSLRTDRIHHIQIAQGESPYRYYLIPDNFMNFSFLRPFKKFQKLLDKFKQSRKYKKRVEIPFASYGGFFMHTEMVKKIGYPDESFYLYYDDAEYTYRVTLNGGKVWLIPGSIITDIDRSYVVNYKRRFLHSIHLDLWNFRTYYLVRNGVYFYRKYALKRPIIFNINKFLFMSYLKFISLTSAKQREFAKLSGAVKDGIKGVLGKADDSKF